jgi:hypothetical protein
LGEEARVKARDQVARARERLDAGHPLEALLASMDALAVDPASEEGAEVAWRAGRQLRASRRRTEPVSEERVAALLARATGGAPDARTALAELALIAPDDARVVDLMKTSGAAR